MKTSKNIFRFPEKHVVDKWRHLVLSLGEDENRDCFLGPTLISPFQIIPHK